MSVGLEGRIDIRLTRRAGSVASVDIRSSRPQVARRLMAGRTPAEAADLAGRIFTLCGNAQQHAAEIACAAATGRDVTGRGQTERVLAELAQEHAWRLLMDWPRQAGREPDPTAVLALRQAGGEPTRLADRLSELLEERVLGEPPAVWRHRDLAGFDAWRRAAGTGTARLFAGLGEGRDQGRDDGPLLPTLAALPEAELADLGRQALAVADFCARPLWRGRPAETGAVARQAAVPLPRAWIDARGRGAGARLLGRLAELAAVPDWLGGEAPAMLRAMPLGDGTGLAGVETSRGLLLHVVRLVAGKVADYRIVAPTEWNFHPAGPLAAALRDVPAGDGLDVRARQVALSLDPCVEYGVELHDA